MQILHLVDSEQACPTFLTDDFGTEIQVLPAEWCRQDSCAAFEQRVVDLDSWNLLIAYGVRSFE